jgi:NAD(P)-dependent dehydrogenase (short-subunit alcohol dehydrogenase family)
MPGAPRRAALRKALRKPRSHRSLSRAAHARLAHIPAHAHRPRALHASVARRVGLAGPLAETPVAQIRACYEANVFGLLAVTQAVVPHMAAARAGTVVNVASVVGLVGTPFAGAYSSSKAAVINASDVLRLELAPFGVSVVTVCPGAIRSHFGDNTGARLQLGAYKMYAPFRNAIAARATASQTAHSTPGDAFAADVVRDVLRPAPPAMHVSGHMAAAFRVLSWLPLRLRDALLARRFGLNVMLPAPQ